MVMVKGGHSKSWSYFIMPTANTVGRIAFGLGGFVSVSHSLGGSELSQTKPNSIRTKANLNQPTPK